MDEMSDAKKPVSAARIQAAKDFGLVNVEAAALACRRAGLPFYAACALLQKESGGRNVYGHDVGGALSGYPKPVDESNFDVFWWLVDTKKVPSNGVGPCQITYAGFFPMMLQNGLKPWVPGDNMEFGFGLLAGYKAATRDWVLAGVKYNGSRAYGEDLAKKIDEWHRRLIRAV